MNQLQLCPQANRVVRTFPWDCNVTVQSTSSYYKAEKHISIRDTTKLSISARSAALWPNAILKTDQMLQLGQTSSWTDCRVHPAYGSSEPSTLFLSCVLLMETTAHSGWNSLYLWYEKFKVKMDLNAFNLSLEDICFLCILLYIFVHTQRHTEVKVKPCRIFLKLFVLKLPWFCSVK